MPKVNGKHFPYTPEGKKAAMKEKMLPSHAADMAKERSFGKQGMAKRKKK